MVDPMRIPTTEPCTANNNKNLINALFWQYNKYSLKKLFISTGKMSVLRQLCAKPIK